MHTVEINKIKRELPSKWNELTREQLLKVSKLLLRQEEKTAFLLKAVFVLLKIRRKLFFRITPLAMTRIINAIDFLSNDSYLTVNKLPVLRIGTQLYSGPEDALTDFSFEQFFQYSELYFELYLQGQNEYLDYLIATLYRPMHTTFDDSLPHFKKIQKLNPQTKTAVFLFYAGCRNLIAYRFPEIFKSGGGSDRKRNDMYFLEMLNSLNDGDATRNAKLRCAPLYEMLVLLQSKIRESEKIKEMQRKQKRK